MNTKPRSSLTLQKIRGWRGKTNEFNFKAKNTREAQEEWGCEFSLKTHQLSFLLIQAGGSGLQTGRLHWFLKARVYFNFTIIKKML